jgi:hypothetical protein
VTALDASGLPAKLSYVLVSNRSVLRRMELSRALRTRLQID